MSSQKRTRSFISPGIMSQIGSVVEASESIAPAGTPEPSELEPGQPIVKTPIESPTPVVEQPPRGPKDVKKTKAESKPAATPITKETPEKKIDKQPVEDANPYKFMKQIRGPLITFDEPYMLAGPEGHEDVDTGMNFRLPLALKETIDEHCHALKVKPSEWMRRAIKYLLAAEQKEMAKLD